MTTPGTINDGAKAIDGAEPSDAGASRHRLAHGSQGVRDLVVVRIRHRSSRAQILSPCAK